MFSLLSSFFLFSALKILKVPYGPFTSSSSSSYSTTRRPPTTTSSYAHVARSSSIADRRSRSRGSRPGQGGSSSSGSAGSSGFIGGVRDPSVDRQEEREREGGDEEGGGGGSNNGESEFQKIQELQDVRFGSRLSSSYLFTDLRWGYGATSSKLATACNNGAVILWDLNRDSATSKLGQFLFSSDISLFWFRALKESLSLSLSPFRSS